MTQAQVTAAAQELRATRRVREDVEVERYQIIGTRQLRYKAWTVDDQGCGMFQTISWREDRRRWGAMGTRVIERPEGMEQDAWEEYYGEARFQQYAEALEMIREAFPETREIGQHDGMGTWSVWVDEESLCEIKEADRNVIIGKLIKANTARNAA